MQTATVKNKYFTHRFIHKIISSISHPNDITKLWDLQLYTDNRICNRIGAKHITWKTGATV